MTVYVDDANIPARVGMYKTEWCHLFSDTSDEELHALAGRIGLSRRWFQHPRDPLQTRRHYDVTPRKRALAVKAGAVEITWREAGRMSMLERRRRNQAAAQAAAHTGGNAEDCPACRPLIDQPGGVQYPWICPGPPGGAADA